MARRELAAACLASAAALVALGCAQALPAQGFVSTRAGLVNRVEGQAQLSEITPNDLPTHEKLHMSPGQRMRTLRGRAEIAIWPEGFWRVYGNSEVELVDDRWENVTIRLIRGQMLVDMMKGWPRKEHSLTIEYGRLKFQPLERGEYELAAREDSPPEFRVHRGRARAMLEEKSLELRKGQALRLDGDKKGELTAIGDMELNRLLNWSRLRREAIELNLSQQAPSLDGEDLAPSEIEWYESVPNLRKQQ